jgi:dGTPase
MTWDKYLNNNRLRPSKREISRDPRNDFESDFGRVIFSPAMRRMHDKTQVFPLTADDNIHSRLTHSMEVMAIGHSLGLRLCENKNFIKKTGRDENSLFRQIPVLLKNACLVHDIGNPPFGHFGETVMQNYFSKLFASKTIIKLKENEYGDFTEFDGNAQGFRVLTKLQILDDIYGLNLTYATLGTFLKYPNVGKIDKSKLATKKRGVYQSEKDYLEKVALHCNLKRGRKIIRHPLCYLMEAADSICYLVMDIEDGYNKGWYGYDHIKSKLSRIGSVKKKIQELDKRKIEFGEEITKIVTLRIFLISTLIDIAITNFTKNLDSICNGTYNHELIYEDKNKLAETLQDFCLTEIFPKRDIQSLELTGHSVLSGLLDYYINFIFHADKNYRKRATGLISSSIIKAALIESGLPPNSKFDELSNYYKLRVIVDFISGMTDQFALNHYQKLSGQKII